MSGDLTAQEQATVRAAIRFLRVQCGAVKLLTKALRCKKTTVDDALARARNVPASVVFRVARFAAVGVDDLLAGRFPPAGTCSHCGRRNADAAQD